MESTFSADIFTIMNLSGGRCWSALNLKEAAHCVVLRIWLVWTHHSRQSSCTGVVKA